MFDMGFTEMMLIGIVALIVIGPERLPAVARTAGRYFGRLKRFMTSVRADVEQELRADELRQILADQQRELDTLKDSIGSAGREFEKEADAIAGAGSLAPEPEPVPEPDGDSGRPATAAAGAAAGDEEAVPKTPKADPEQQPAAREAKS